MWLSDYQLLKMNSSPWSKSHVPMSGISPLSSESEIMHVSDAPYRVALSADSAGLPHWQVCDFVTCSVMRHMWTATDFLTSNPVLQQLMLMDAVRSGDLQCNVSKQCTPLPPITKSVRSVRPRRECFSWSLLTRLLRECPEVLRGFPQPPPPQFAC
jgi:hypothetical protein